MAVPACLRAHSHEYGNADALIFFPLNGQFLRIPVMMTGQSGSIDTRTKYPQSLAASGQERTVGRLKADAQRWKQLDRNVCGEEAIYCCESILADWLCGLLAIVTH
ncbi:hypothetical protein D3C71_1703860 [compost metagenome]